MFQRTACSSSWLLLGCKTPAFFILLMIAIFPFISWFFLLSLEEQAIARQAALDWSPIVLQLSARNLQYHRLCLLPRACCYVDVDVCVIKHQQRVIASSYFDLLQCTLNMFVRQCVYCKGEEFLYFSFSYSIDLDLSSAISPTLSSSDCPFQWLH